MHISTVSVISIDHSPYQLRIDDVIHTGHRMFASEYGSKCGLVGATSERRLFSVSECEKLGQVNKELEPKYTLQAEGTECANVSEDLLCYRI